MMIKKSITVFCLAALLGMASCNTEKKKSDTVAEVPEKITVSSEEKTDKADGLVEATIKAHGGKLYDNAFYTFTFRDQQYTFENKNGSFTYAMSRTEDGDTLRYTLKSGATLTHTVNGSETQLSKKDIAKYTEDVNSVIYFATLPHKLKDSAVKNAYMGRTTIEGQDYETLRVTFEKEGGGKDYEDEFLYWINADTKTIDYLAYNYETNDGGVRFRSAYNPRTVDGIRFQDYINYKAAIGTPLGNLPALYEKGELEELSRIETEDVVSLRH